MGFNYIEIKFPNLSLYDFIYKINLYHINPLLGKKFPTIHFIYKIIISHSKSQNEIYGRDFNTQIFSKPLEL